MRLSSLIMVVHDTNCHSLWRGLGNPYRCLSSVLPSTLISVSLHVLTTPPPTGDERPSVLRAKKRIILHTSTFTHACSRPAILIWIAGRSDPLTMRTCDCMTTHTCYTCPLHGEISRRMMLFHVKHAVTFRLVGNQFDLLLYVYLNPLHVSSNCDLHTGRP